MGLGLLLPWAEVDRLAGVQTSLQAPGLLAPLRPEPFIRQVRQRWLRAVYQGALLQARGLATAIGSKSIGGLVRRQQKQGLAFFQ